ncbi:MAG: 50S ribosomal protein L1 [Candidatus Micrarchaeota archaeon]|nr:50S ribosomal protein L1 [Candidatus Micrarchaeota archaeon]
MEQIKIEDFTKFIEENKGTRKFKQSVELAVNFKGIDFNKQDNKLNLEVNLPHGKGKVKKLGLFATEKTLIENAEKLGIEVFDGAKLDALAGDSTRMNNLLNYDLIAQQSLMPNIARFLGQFLGPRNKMPKPLVGNMTLTAISNEMTKRITIKTKGKNLPTIHCVVGSEDIEPKKLYENMHEVLNTIVKKIGQNRIKSAYIKLSMSKPVRVV